MDSEIGRQEQRGQDSQDADDNEKLHKGEGTEYLATQYYAENHIPAFLS